MRECNGLCDNRSRFEFFNGLSTGRLKLSPYRMGYAYCTKCVKYVLESNAFTGKNDSKKLCPCCHNNLRFRSKGKTRFEHNESQIKKYEEFNNRKQDLLIRRKHRMLYQYILKRAKDIECRPSYTYCGRIPSIILMLSKLEEKNSEGGRPRKYFTKREKYAAAYQLLKKRREEYLQTDKALYNIIQQPKRLVEEEEQVFNTQFVMDKSVQT